MSSSCYRLRFTIAFCYVICISLNFCCTNAYTDAVDEPTFKYLERWLLRITYPKGPNHALYTCCNGSSHDSFLHICEPFSKCPDYRLITQCATRGDNMCCEINYVADEVHIQGYVGWFNGNKTIPLSAVATYVTNSSEKVPRSVSKINVTTNSQQGLDIHWSPLDKNQHTHGKHSYCAVCHPQENEKAKSAVHCVDFSNSKVSIASGNLTAVSKYRCCVRVVNVLTSQQSEPTCQNVITSEKAPSSPPVIICGNHTKQCPFEIIGSKRNITIYFQLPRPEDRNGKIIQNEVYYRNKTADDFKKLTFTNGSSREAVLTNIDTDLEYVVFMKSCTKIGCSPKSNVIIIPAVAYSAVPTKPDVVIAILTVVAFVIVSLVIIWCCIMRHKRRQRQKQLPPLKPESKFTYDYPDNPDKKDEVYDEIESETSSIKKTDALVIENIMAVPC